MIPLTTTRLAVNIVSALGVSKVVGDIIKNNVVVVTKSQRILVQAGGFVLGSMIVDHAVAHVNKTIDEVVAWKNQNVNVKPDAEVSLVVVEDNTRTQESPPEDNTSS